MNCKTYRERLKKYSSLLKKERLDALLLVLLALLSLGIKNITLGPTLPVCLSPNVLKVLVENLNIRPHTTVEEDMKALMKQA